MTVIILASTAVFLGALVRGYTGFGASMFWVASLSLIYPPASVVPTVLALEVLASSALLPRVFRHVDWKSMRWMLAGSVATMPAGILLLSTLPDRQMRVIVAASILSATIAVGCGVKIAHEPGPVSALTAGSVSGLVNGSTGMGGPPAILLYFSSTSSTELGRATLIAYFLGTDAVGFAMMATYGMVDSAVMTHTLVFAPLALGGIALGQQTFKRTSGTGFRGVVLAVLLALSLATLGRAVLFG